MHFSHAVATIQSLVGSIKGVQILYSDKVWNKFLNQLMQFPRKFNSLPKIICPFWKWFLLSRQYLFHPDPTMYCVFLGSLENWSSHQPNPGWNQVDIWSHQPKTENHRSSRHDVPQAQIQVVENSLGLFLHSHLHLKVSNDYSHGFFAAMLSSTAPKCLQPLSKSTRRSEQPIQAYTTKKNRYTIFSAQFEERQVDQYLGLSYALADIWFPSIYSPSVYCWMPT